MQTELMDKAKKYRWMIFTILALGYVLVYFHRLCPAVLAVDMMQDLHATGTLTGLLGAAYFYPYALMQLPAGSAVRLLGGPQHHYPFLPRRVCR